MTVSGTSVTAGPFTGNDSITSLPFSFKVTSTSQIVVEKTLTSSGAITSLVLDTDYTVTFDEGAETGTVTLTSALETGYTAMVYRSTSPVQSTDFTGQGSFAPASHEARMDLITQMIQEHAEKLARSPQFNIGAGNTGIFIDDPVASRVIAWNASATKLVAAAASSIAESVDTLISGATKNDVLVYDGSQFINLPFAVSPYNYGAVGDGITDDTAAWAAAIATGLPVACHKGMFKLSDALNLLDNSHVFLGPKVRFNQTVVNKNIFKATQKDNITLDCNGAVLYGEGTYSNSWTGMSGHEGRVIQFLGCTRFHISRPHIKNADNAGIAIIGCSRGSIEFPVIEGTHEYSTALTTNDNFQVGIFLQENATYGTVDDLKITSPDISNTAQGIVVESYSGFSTVGLNVTISSPTLHEIRGQHGAYLQAGGVTITGASGDNIALDGIKIQSGSSNQDIKGFTVTGFKMSNCGSHGVSVITAGSGAVTGFTISGVTHDCQRGLGIQKNCRNGRVEIETNGSTQHGAYLTGDGLEDIDLYLHSKNSGRNGLLIDATNTSGITVEAKIREPNTSAGSYHGVHIQSASADITFEDLDVTDADSNMLYGVFSDTAGAQLRFRGSVNIDGPSAYGVRFANPVLEWPTEASVNGDTGDFYSNSNIQSSQPFTLPSQTTSASNVLAWSKTLSDESAYMITADLIAKLSGSAERAIYRSTVCVYRNGGTATIEGSADTDVSVASASSNAAYAWAVSSNDIRLNINSGASETYDWKIRLSVLALSD